MSEFEYRFDIASMLLATVLSLLGLATAHSEKGWPRQQAPLRFRYEGRSADATVQPSVQAP
jgi:hypothetical protein